MMKSLKWLHLGWCLLLWTFWAVGIILVAVRHGDISFFWNLAEPFNRIVIFGSLVPVEPTLFISTVMVEGKRNASSKQLWLHGILCIVTFLLFLAYMVTYVAWTGGV